VFITGLIVRRLGGGRCDDCMTWRRDESIWVGRRSVVPLDRIWAKVRVYI
jgi:hypothetical protein